MNKNILHVVNIYFVLPYFIGDQFKYFKEKGYNMNVVCSPSEYLSDYAQKQGFEYLESPVNRNISISQDFVSIRNICKFVKKQKIDIVVGHTPKGGLLAMIAGWLMRVPIRIYVRHGLVYETSKGLKRFILMSVDRLTSFCSTKVVCVSPSVLRKSIEDHLAPAKKQMIWHKGTCNGIDTLNHFNPAVIVPARLTGLKARYGIGEDDFVIGYSGRLVRDKGIIELVRAFDKLQLADNCKLLLVGMFEKRDALPEDIQERILNDSRIIYTGFINGGMEYFYSMMDIYMCLLLIVKVFLPGYWKLRRWKSLSLRRVSLVAVILLLMEEQVFLSITLQRILWKKLIKFVWIKLLMVVKGVSG